MRGRALLAALAGCAALLLAALGVWQVERRAWKLDLIARVEARVRAAAVPLSPDLGAEDEYRRVRTGGRWRPVAPVLVKAVTALGSGWWVMAPLDTLGGTVLINRGFVPDAERGTVAPAQGSGEVVGLVRVSEPGGAFLRNNDPVVGRWFSRDVAAIAGAQGWRAAAPIFIDAEATGTGWPRGGMTVVSFRNTHLVYALTWFALAGIAAAFAWKVARSAPSRREAAA